MLILDLNTCFSGGRWGVLISHLFKKFPHFVVIHTIKYFGSHWSRTRCFSAILLIFLWSNDVDNLISDFSKSSLNIGKFLVHVLMKPSLEESEHYFASVWNEYNCAVVCQTFFGIGFLWDWNENWSFPVLRTLLIFPNLLAYWVQHFHSIIFLGFEMAQLQFHHLH